MKTKKPSVNPPFINIPAIGNCPARIVDPLNREHLKSIIQRADAYFKLSKNAWERGNDGTRNEDYINRQTMAELDYAHKGESLLIPFGIKCQWPGLYPSFQCTRRQYGDEKPGFVLPFDKNNCVNDHTTQSAIISALGLPRDFFIK